MKQTLDLSSLSSDYEILGELEGAPNTRVYLGRRITEGKRRDDRSGVLITVVSTPEGDESNALSHLAADTKLLIETSHRRLIPVLDGRWLGDDAFAVITQRTTDTSLAERLMTGENFSNPRIAAILRELNGLLEWARGQHVIHRSIPSSRVFLEATTDRVRASFTIAPLKRLHRSDEHDDARTIARLAMAMLTGESDPRAYEGRTLAELRPDLPERLVTATTALLDAKAGDPPPDVAGFLALIGMADPVAAGEAERERIRAEILEEQRTEREKLAADRTALEDAMAAERAAFDKQMAADRAAYERAQNQAREKTEREQEKERERLERERQELQAAVTREREALQRAAAAERDQVTAKRAELAKMEKRLVEQREELERAAARDRQQIAELREQLRQAGEREIERKRATALEEIDTEAGDELDRPELAPTPFVAPMLAPLEPLTFDDSPLMSDEAIVFAPSRMVEPEEPEEPAVEEGDESPALADASSAPVVAGAPGTSNRRRWILGGSVAAVLVLVGITATVLGGREPATPPAPSVRTATVAPKPVQAAPARDTVATPIPALVIDSASTRSAARWLDSLKDAHPVELPRRVVREEEPERPRRVEPPEQSEPAPRPRPSMVDDPFFIPGSTPRRDTTAPSPAATSPTTPPEPVPPRRR